MQVHEYYNCFFFCFSDIPQEGPTITFNAATTLRNFCIWQQAQNILDDAHPSHHDTAVLITRYGIERDNYPAR